MEGNIICLPHFHRRHNTRVTLPRGLETTCSTIVTTPLLVRNYCKCPLRFGLAKVGNNVFDPWNLMQCTFLNLTHPFVETLLKISLQFTLGQDPCFGPIVCLLFLVFENPLLWTLVVISNWILIGV